MGIDSCPSCGNNHFIYNGTSKACARCGAVYIDNFADLPTEPVQSVQKHAYDLYFVAGIVLTIIALSTSLISYLDSRLLLVSLGFFILAEFPLIVFRIGNMVKSTNTFTNWLLIFGVINIIVSVVRLVTLKL